MGAIFGGVAGSLLSQKVGRKLTLAIISMGFVVGWGFVYVASSATLLYFGRFVTGFFTGMVSLCVPAYVAEVASPRYRGNLVGPDYFGFRNIRLFSIKRSFPVLKFGRG